MNYNDTASFSKFFQFLPLSFDVLVSIEKIVAIRFCDFSINAHSQRKFYYYNRFHYLFLLIFNFNEISNTKTSLVDARRNPTNQVGRRLAAVLHTNSILDGLAGMRSLMTTNSHPHRILACKINK
nr:MAG TPA: hypothetical protein [Caudoviricetes sp.]